MDLGKIWITRPELDATRFCDELEAAQLAVPLSPILFSLLDARFYKLEPELFFTPPKLSALVATSRNGVRALSQMKSFESLTALPFFAVGKATGELARSLGFEDVRVGPGRAEQLLPLILEYDQSCFDDVTQRILNLRGDEQSFDMKAAFEKSDLPLNSQFEDVVSYHMQEADELSPEVINALKNNEITAVVLMSPRTARIYCRLMKQNELISKLKDIWHFCLSEAVADVLKEELADLEQQDIFSNIVVSSFPDQSHMIDCIKSTQFD